MSQDLEVIFTLTGLASAAAAGLVLLTHRRVNVQKAAAALGLDYDRVWRSAEGVVAGVRVGAGQAKIVEELVSTLKLHSLDARKKPIVRLAARLDPPLDLGLELNHISALGLRAGLPAEKLRRRYAMCGDEPDRVGALVEQGLRAEVERLARRGTRVWVCDGGVLLEPKRWTSTQTVVAQVEHALEIINQIDGLRAEIPVAEVLRPMLDDGWAELARQRELEVLKTPLRLESEKLAAGATRLRKQVFEMYATARFVPPLDLDLFGRSTQNVGLDVKSVSDVTTGDLDFDTVYELRANDERELRVLFGRDLRRMLLELAQTYDVSLDDRGITLRAPLGPRGVLSEMLDRVEAASELLGRNHEHAVYR